MSCRGLEAPIGTLPCTPRDVGGLEGRAASTSVTLGKHCCHSCTENRAQEETRMLQGSEDEAGSGGWWGEKRLS